MYQVYKVTNKINQKYYYGVQKFRKGVENYYGSGPLIKNAIKKYGKNNFIKEILFEYDDEKLAYDKEKELITENEINNEMCYNVNEGGHGSFSYINSLGLENPMKNPEISKKMTESLKKTRLKNKEYYDNISKQNLKKAVEKNKGTKRSDETRKKISESNKGRIISDEHKQILSETHSGKKLSDEHKNKLSQLMRDRIANNPDCVKNNLGKKFSEETKQRMSDAAKERWKNTPIITCSYCGYSSKSKGNMNRFHFENCKNKKEL